MLLIAVTGIFWTAAVVRSWRWRKSPTNPALRAIAIALLAISVALTLDLPVVRVVFAGGRGAPDGTVNPGDLGKQLAIVVGAWACQSLLLHLTRGPEVTRASEGRRAALAVTVAVASTLIYLVPVLQGSPQRPEAGIATPWITESRLLVLLYAGTVLAYVAHLCWTHTARGSLGRGVAVMGAGCAVMVIYALTRIAYFSAANYAQITLPALYRTGDLLQVTGLAVIAIGTLIPWAGRLARNRRMRRAHAGLEPLWAQVTSLVPAVVLGVDPQRDAATWALDRRVVEIQDALVILAPQLQLPEDGSPAQRLAAALAQLQEPATVILPASTASTASKVSAIAAPDGTSSVQWLLEVSDALARHQERISA